MSTKFQVIALSSFDPEGRDTRDEPMLQYADALKAAREFKSQGKAFRVVAEGSQTEKQLQSFVELGAVV